MLFRPPMPGGIITMKVLVASMNLVKILVSILVALLVVLAIALVIGYSSLNSLTEMAIETVGPEVTKTSVQVERVDIELTKGQGGLQGMTVANPPGFSAALALYLETLSAQLDTATLAEPVIVVEQLVVAGVRINAEQGVGDSNLQVLLANIQAVPDVAVQLPSTAGPDLRFLILQARFTDMVLQMEDGTRIPLEDMQLADLGDPERGLTSAQLTRELLQPILAAAQGRLTQ